MTYNQALAAGYKRSGITLQRGYVKRKAPYLAYYDQELIPAGGSRKGQFYVLLPCFHTSCYCERHYQTPPEV